MTDAFQCDRCSEFDTATPKRYRLKEYRSGGTFGWNDDRNLQSLELCDDCADSLETTVGEWLGAKNDD